jgi:acetyltransferase
VAAACELGYPVVLKVVGPSHKSDVHGVVLGLRDDGEVKAAATRLLAIDGARGLMVQRQVGGLELIVGASREDKFGHLVLFGLGGIFTEALRDVTAILAPCSPEEATRALGRIRGARLLDGFRGRPAVDRTALGRALWAVATLVHRFPEIREMDVNPLLATGAELWAVDARIEIDCASG